MVDNKEVFLKTTYAMGTALLLWLIAVSPGTSFADSDKEKTVAVHSDAAYSFTMKFPTDFTVTTDPTILARQSYLPITTGTEELGGFYSGREYADTNFGSACIIADVIPAKKQENDCARFEGETACADVLEIRDIKINGTLFKYAILSDAAAGHRLETREYWTIHKGHRYEIRLCLSYTDIGMYSPGEKKEFNQKECWARLNNILKTFRFSPPGAAIHD